MKHEERIMCVREIPVEKLFQGVWHDYTFVEETAYKITDRHMFTPSNGADPRYQFELYDDDGYFINAYRIKKKIWDDSVKVLEVAE